MIDIRAPNVADAIPERANAVIHLAALSRDADCRNNAASCFDVNVMGTLNLMRAAKIRGIRQFVFASTEWVYDGCDTERPLDEGSVVNAARLDSEYALSKYVCENLLRLQARRGFCPTTVLRFGIVYGPRRDNWSAVESLLHSVATAEKVKVGSLATARRFIYRSDVVDAIFASIGREVAFEVFDVQGPELASLGRVVETASRLLGRIPKVTETAPDAPQIRAVSGSKAFAELGWRAGVGLHDGMSAVVAYLGYARRGENK